MIRLSEIRLPFTVAEAPEAPLRAAASQILGIADADIAHLHVFKRSFDARKADLLAVYIVDITLTQPAREAALLAQFAGNPHIQPTPDMAWHPVGQAPADLPLRPVVVGFGPCGIFAALVLAQMGFKPIVLERGKTVRERTKDTWGLWRKRELHAESNVQFGEGGAGTFSDGKLYSQIKDPRHLGRKVMNEFVVGGAEDFVAGIGAETGFVDHRLRVFDAETDGEGLGFHMHAAAVEHAEGVASAVAEGQDHMAAGQLLATVEHHATQLTVFDQHIADLLLEAHFTAQGFDLLTHVGDHARQAEGANVWFADQQNFFGCTSLDKLGHHFSAKKTRVFDLAVQFAV